MLVEHLVEFTYQKYWNDNNIGMARFEGLYGRPYRVGVQLVEWILGKQLLLEPKVGVID